MHNNTQTLFRQCQEKEKELAIIRMKFEHLKESKQRFSKSVELLNKELSPIQSTINDKQSLIDEENQRIYEKQTENSS